MKSPLAMVPTRVQGRGILTRDRAAWARTLTQETGSIPVLHVLKQGPDLI